MAHPHQDNSHADTTRPEVRIIWMLLVSLGCFSLARLSLWLGYFEDFKVLSVAQTLEAFLVGIRFDLSIMTLSMLMPFMMLLFAPIRPSAFGRAWGKFWSWLAYVILMVLVLMMIADYLYFEDAHRHVGSEIKAIGEDWKTMLSLAWRQYLGVTALFLCFVGLSAFGWQRFTQPVLVFKGNIAYRVLLIAGCFMAAIVAIRGGVFYRPIAKGDAFFSNQITQGYLVLNGPFSITRALAAPAIAPVEMMSNEAAEQRVRNLFGRDYEKDMSALEFHSSAMSVPHAKPNVVILLLESWGSLQVDAMRQQMHLPKLGATPNFDKLVERGRLFTNFYATGQRSIVGLSTIMTGLPVLPDMPAMGDGMEQFPINFIGDVAKSKGYETLFAQSSDRLSLRLNVISGRAGFDDYLGSEDMPEQHDTVKPSGVWGTWDHNTLQEVSKRFASMKAPFFGFVFTSTTHSPWFTPGKQWEKFPTDTDFGRSLNAMFYADWALGEFIASAKKAGYYDNTIFILLADHSSQFIERREDARNLFRIPLLMVGPSVKPGVDTRLSSQSDLLPTLMDVTGWEGRYKSAGQSLMRAERGHGAALGVSDRAMTLITPNGWLSHDLTQRLGHSQMSDDQVQAMEQDLFALYQTTAKVQLEGVLNTKKQIFLRENHPK